MKRRVTSAVPTWRSDQSPTIQAAAAALLIDRVSRHNAVRRALDRKQKKAVVCVVDDDAYLLRAIDRLLTASGFKVLPFATPEEILASNRWMKAACVVMDIRLGRTSGIDFHRHLTTIGLAAPVIFITAYDDAVSRKQAQRAGAAAYLPKPFEEGCLAAAVRSAIAEAETARAPAGAIQRR